MGRYVARRLIQFIPVILGTLFLLHMLSTVTIQVVGDPVRALFGENAPPAAVIEQLQTQYGLDDPCLQADRQPVRRAVRRSARPVPAGRLRHQLPWPRGLGALPRAGRGHASDAGHRPRLRDRRRHLHRRPGRSAQGQVHRQLRAHRDLGARSPSRCSWPARSPSSSWDSRWDCRSATATGPQSGWARCSRSATTPSTRGSAWCCRASCWARSPWPRSRGSPGRA